MELLKRKYPRPTIARGVYYFSSAKGQQERKRIDRPSTAATTAVLSDLQERDCVRHVRSRRRRVGVQMVRLRQRLR